MSEQTGWREQASCGGLDTNLFVPSTELLEPPAWVQRLCHGCPVQGPCLDEALKFKARGYWAATTFRQRRAAEETGRPHGW